MEAYRLAEKRVTPKLRILEEHIIPWIRKWGVGVGFHSEQGAESIHALFNSLLRTYASTHNPTQRMDRVMREHYLKNSPQNIASIPAIKRRKKKNKNLVICTIYLLLFVCRLDRSCICQVYSVMIPNYD